MPRALVTFAVCCTSWAACADRVGPAPAGEERLVAAFLEHATDLVFWGDRVVVRVTDPERDSGNTLRMLDLATGVTASVHDDTLYAHGHDVWGDSVAWFDERGLVLLDTGTGDVSVFPELHGRRISLRGSRVAFEGGRGGETGLVVTDLSTGAGQVFPRGGEPRVWGDRVVWIETFRATPFLGSRSVIKGFDFRTGDTTALVNVRTSLGLPSIGPGRTAWTVPVELPPDASELVGFDFDAGSPFTVPGGPRIRSAPVLLDRHVAWLEARAGDVRLAVHLYSFVTGLTTRVGDWGAGGLRSDGRRLLWWIDDRLFLLTP